MAVPTTSVKQTSRLGVRRLSRFLVAFLAVALLIVAYPQADAKSTKQQISDLKQQQQQINQNKASLQTKISAVQNDKAQLVQKKYLLEEQIEVIRSELQVTNTLIAQYDEQIAEKTAELEKAKAEEARYYALFCERVRTMEEDGQVSYVAVLFHASDFSDLIDRINMISEVMDHDNRMMDSLKAARAAVADAKTQLEDMRAGQVEAKKSLEGSQADLKQQQAALDALIAEMKAKEAQYKDKLDDLAEDSVDLSNDIEAAEHKYAAEIEAARKQHEQQAGSSGGSANLTGSGGFIWPLPGHTDITSKYGTRTHPISGRQSFHGGVDIGAGAGTRIIAAKAGTVVISGYNSSYGNYVAIAHYDGSKTLYAHMKARAVSEGAGVSQGATIGYVGSTGSSTGNHLHFEIWKGSSSSTRTNPMGFF